MLRGALRPERTWSVTFLFALVLTTLPATPAAPGAAWESCRARVVAALEAKGLREYGDPAAYTGATGSGAMAEVIERCGYRTERLDPELCDDIYRQVYLSCREDGYDGMSMAALSWVAMFDPQGPLVGQLRRLCAKPESIGRAAFGKRVCGE